MAQPVLAGLLPVVGAPRQRIGLGAAHAPLDQPEVGDVPADRGLGSAEPPVTERGDQLLLGPDVALAEQVLDGLLPEPLHHVHAHRASSSAPTTTANTIRYATKMPS